MVAVGGLGGSARGGGFLGSSPQTAGEKPAMLGWSRLLWTSSSYWIGWVQKPLQQEFVDVLCRRLTLMYLRFNKFPLGSSNRKSGVAIFVKQADA